MQSNLFTCIVLLLLCACAPTGTQLPATDQPSQAPAIDQATVQKNLGTIAVAQIAISHPLAQRVFSSQIIQDSLSGQLTRSGRVNVIDWSRFKEVLFRRNLEWSDLVDSQDGRKQIKDVLFNDYFLTGSLFSYGERMDYSASAFAKSKVQIAEVEVEFFVKDALSNEILISARGEGKTSKKITQTLGFGAAGSSDISLAYAALDQAITESVQRLIRDLEQLKSTE